MPRARSGTDCELALSCSFLFRGREGGRSRGKRELAVFCVFFSEGNFLDYTGMFIFLTRGHETRRPLMNEIGGWSSGGVSLLLLSFFSDCKKKKKERKKGPL